MESTVKKLFKKFFGSKTVFSICTFIYVAVLGPFLVSATSDFAVILGLVLLVLFGYWANYVFFNGSRK